MATIQLICPEIIQYRLKFKVNDKDVNITLTKSFCTWHFKILEGRKLNLEEIDEICNLIYAERIICGSDRIRIHFNDNEFTYIHS